jgi:hypothetical protein
MPKYEAKIKSYEHAHQIVSHTFSKRMKLITFGLADVTSHPQSMAHDLQGFPYIFSMANVLQTCQPNGNVSVCGS